MSKELTTTEVAKRFGVTGAAVRLWCARGLFSGARSMDTPRGPVWMIPERDLQGFAPPKPTGRPRKSPAPAEEVKDKAA